MITHTKAVQHQTEEFGTHRIRQKSHYAIAIAEKRNLSLPSTCGSSSHHLAQRSQYNLQIERCNFGSVYVQARIYALP